MRMKFPPGYGYPSREDWQRINAENDPSRSRKGNAMIWLWVLLGIYAIGFVLTLWFNLAIGPLTPALCLLRAAVWPIFWATGWPQGVPMPMD